ncbi:MAG: DNA-binding domain-containing protein [Spirochaetales bacterium]|nr:DNA-binding domain-containing protein [Spirochaetales bacterium]
MTKMNYYLRKNPLATENGSPYMARVARKETLWQEDIINRMMKKNTTVTYQDILVVLNLMKETVKEESLSGNPIIMDLFKIQPGIRGGFNSADDEFDRDRHKVILNMNPSKEFREDILQSSELTKIGVKEELKQIEYLFDYDSWSIGESFPAGGIVELKGRNLLSLEPPEVLLQKEGSDESIPAAKIFNHSERSILFSLPADLERGKYKLTVNVIKAKARNTLEYENLISVI